MKKWLILIIAVLAMVSLWACGNTDSTSTEVTQPTPTSVVKDAKVVFEEWLAAAKSINSEQAHYKSTIDMSMKGSSQPTTLTISGELAQKGNKRFDEVDVTIGPTTEKMREYAFDKEVFVATMVEGQWISEKATPAIYFNYLDVLA